MSYSRTVIHGRLGRDPELSEKQGTTGPYKSVTFTVAVDRIGDGVDWYRCSMNGRRAEAVAKFFRKGSQIIVEGRMESYTGRDGALHWALRATDFDFCEPNTRGTAPAETPAEPAPVQQQMAFEPVDDDIPF